MHADAAEMQGSKAQKQGGKTRLLTLADLDSRTRACKHALGLRGNFPCQNAQVNRPFTALSATPSPNWPE